MNLSKFSCFIGCLIVCFSCCTNKKSGNEKMTPAIDEFTAYNYPETTQLMIAPRAPNALNGSQIIQHITDLSLAEREDYILNEVKNGNIPDFLRKMVKVSARAYSKGRYRSITYYVLPDYIALGSNSDYFLCPMTPGLGQKIAEGSGCFLPTRKMADQIWEAGTVKMEPQPIPPGSKMTTVPVFKQHNSIVLTQRKTFMASGSLGNLVVGTKKDVVISPLIHSTPDRVIIYGWHTPSGKNIQPLYAGHHKNYVDYSHGIRLIQKNVYVDGIQMLASDVLRSEELHSLLSDEGPVLKPYYPN